MFEAAKHLSDETILRFIDHEFDSEMTHAIRSHLSACQECRRRQSEFEHTSDALNRTYEDQFDGLSINKVQARHRLQSGLKNFSSRSTGTRRIVVFSFKGLAVAALGAACLVVFLIRPFINERAHSLSVEASIPDPALTPGAVRPVTLNEVCTANDGDLDPEVSPSVERAVLREYGIDPAKHAKDYQIDYLVNPQLGGTADIKNLWPEPYSGREWNAHAKDILERQLHQMVCEKKVDLAAAQRDIATDWISAYRRYVRLAHA